VYVPWVSEVGQTRWYPNPKRSSGPHALGGCSPCVALRGTMLHHVANKLVLTNVQETSKKMWFRHAKYVFFCAKEEPDDYSVLRTLQRGGRAVPHGVGSTPWNHKTIQQAQRCAWLAGTELTVRLSTCIQSGEQDNTPAPLICRPSPPAWWQDNQWKSTSPSTVRRG
jgi:hypothetical protein